MFDVWYAYYQCEPFGSHWEQTATLAAMLSAQHSLTAAVHGITLPAASVLHFMPSDTMPWRKRKELRQRKGLENGKLQHAHLVKSFGFNR